MVERKFPGNIAIAASDYDKERDYWVNRLSGDWQKSYFPYSRKQAGRQMERVEMTAGGELFSRLLKVSRDSDYVLHMILIACAAALLARYTGSGDIVVGVPIYEQGEDANFLNTILPIRISIDEKQGFRDLLVDVRQAMLEAQQNQNYPVEMLPDRLNRSYSRPDDEFPLFDTAVLLENIHRRSYIDHVHPNAIFSFYRGETRLDGVLEYNAQRYRKHTAGQIARHFKGLLQSAIFDVQQPLWRIDILTGEEKKQLLVDFNDTFRDYPAEKTIAQLFREQAAQTPDRISLVIRSGGAAAHMTYSRLSREVEKLARRLKQEGVLPGAIVGMMVERSLQMITGILAVLEAGCAYLPIEPRGPVERLDYMLADSGANILLTLDSKGEFVLNWREGSRAVCQSPGGAGLAYVIYTSGTTGKPKGTLIAHYNVTRVVKNTNYIEITPADRLPQLSNYAFDGSVFDIYGALLNGAALVVIDREDVLAVDRLARVITGEAVTVFFVTSALFNVLVDLKLDCLRHTRKILAGGDRLSVEHARKALHYLGKGRIINVYGPTETTVFATYYPVDNIGAGGKSIPIGRPAANTSVYILDRNLLLLPVGVSGEIYIGGCGTARGYLNRPGLTAEAFCPRRPFGESLFEKSSAKTFASKRWRFDGRLYKSGDLGRWLAGGDIEFLGRVDHQVKIRGFRVEPGEIENFLARVDFVKEAVVTVGGDGQGETYLCAYVVPVDQAEEEFDIKRLKKILTDGLPGYMIPAYFVPLPALPLTPNGKVDRKALPGPGTGAAADDCTAPRGPVEETIAHIWSEVLDIPKEKIGIDSDFFHLGGHSLRATILVARLHRAFNVKIPKKKVFETPTIRELARSVKHSQPDRFVSLAAAEKREYYRLSSAQKRLYILQRMDRESVVYNVPQAVELEGRLDVEKLEQTFKRLIQRHESLRTSFHLVNGEPVQRIHDSAEFEIASTSLDARGAVTSFFDLSRPPLLRVGLIELEAAKYILMIDMHHIITDGASMDIFLQEFITLYAGGELPPLKLQYKDYAQWQTGGEQRKAMQSQEQYWLSQFEEEIPALELPIDFPRPLVQATEGSTVHVVLPARDTAGLNRLARENGLTLYMVLLAAAQVLLGKLSGREDILAGAPIAARRHADLENIIGMFVNTLALRNFPTGTKTASEFLAEVKKSTLEAFENQEYPFEDLVENVVRERDVSRHPLIDAAFLLQNMNSRAGNIPTTGIPGLTVKPYEIPIETSKFDLSLICAEGKEDLVCTFEYCVKLFKRPTVQRFAVYFKKILSSFLHDVDIPIGDIEIVSEEEKRQVIFDFNDTASSYPRDMDVCRLIERQAMRMPDGAAVVGECLCLRRPFGESLFVKSSAKTFDNAAALTYRELWEMSGRVAAGLEKKGVRVGDIAGIMMGRSVDMIVGILGIMRAGAAYLPIDENFPQERRDYMLKDSSAAFLLTPDSLANLLNTAGTKHPSRSAAAYVIYTSGTTGRPKGVMVDHTALVNFVYAASDLYGNDFGPPDNCLSLTSICFDVSVCEIFVPLVSGSTLVVYPYDKAFDPAELAKVIIENAITFTYIPPGLLTGVYKKLKQHGGVRIELGKMLVGVEPIRDDVLEDYLALNPRLQLVNGYGPTEATIFATAYRYNSREPAGRRIPIGSPLANMQVLILDNYGRPVPLGVAGELYIAGHGLARGYINNPELTIQKFFRGARGAIFQKSQHAAGPANSVLAFSDASNLISHPYREPQHGARRRQYKTGDLARWLADGNIEFIGRRDQQVKIRGYRVELEEIEQQLTQHKDAAAAVVKAWETETGEKYLCAYIVPANKDKKIDIQAVKQFLSDRLPAYMVPSYFMTLDEMPRNTSGKLDRKKLPQPERLRPELEIPFAPPGTRMEKIIAQSWQQVLELDRVGIHDNFFDLGGTSLGIIKVNAAISEHFGKDIPLLDMFRYPTVQALAGHLENKGMGELISDTEIDEKIDRLEQTFHLLTGDDDD
jgi:amino acid adenylation domain-containing protein